MTQAGDSYGGLGRFADSSNPKGSVVRVMAGLFFAGIGRLMYDGADLPFSALGKGRYDGRFIENDAAAADINQSICGAEVDCHVARQDAE